MASAALLPALCSARGCIRVGAEGAAVMSWAALPTGGWEPLRLRLGEEEEKEEAFLVHEFLTRYFTRKRLI